MKESINASWSRQANQLTEDSSLNPADVLTYTALLDHCTDSLTCTVGMSALSKRLQCMSPRTILRALEHLEQCGYLTRIRVTGEANTYQLADIIGLKRSKQPSKQKQTSKHHAAHATEEPEQGQQEIKLAYGKYKNVLLTMDEFDRLAAEYGTRATAYIEKCDSYCQSTGKSYADYNATIRRWIATDEEKQLPKDEVKRQEFEELDDYLSLVNRFDLD